MWALCMYNSVHHESGRTLQAGLCSGMLCHVAGKIVQDLSK